MTIAFEAPGVVLHHGDCIDVMRTLPDQSVDVVITDPPYGIAFMGKDWDQPNGFGSTVRKHAGARSMKQGPTGIDSNLTTERGAAMEAGRYDLSPSAMRNFQRWCEAWAAECFRILKPGGHIFSFGGARTWHRLAAGIEDAGFEVRDSIAWLFGSGFPKSMNVAKAIASGTGRPEDIRRMNMGDAYEPSGRGRTNYDNGSASKMNGAIDVDVDLPDHAKAWEGWGTALKPAFEPIVVARKPLSGTVASNVLTYGTGALNIDATRTPTNDSLGGGAMTGGGLLTKSDGWSRPWMQSEEAIAAHAERVTANVEKAESLGRWPTNVLLDESQASDLDAQTGILTSGKMRAGQVRSGNATVYGNDDRPVRTETHGDAGGASRFFPTFHYEAKAPGSERPDVDGVMHPTVKPLELMRWLIRLATPPNGTILEPFAGSGTTLEAALLEGFSVIGIEREADYMPLIEKRITKPLQPAMFGDWEEDAA